MKSGQVNLEVVTIELARRGVDLRKLASEASQVVLFGSWAVGLQRPESDIDLLCVGDGKRHKTAKVDLVWISPKFGKSTKWRQSELGNHIIKYGKWLVGSNEWGDDVRVSSQSLQFKRSLIRSRGSQLMRRWDHLSQDYRGKHAVKIRRDIQRLVLMKSGNAVPASPQLDALWAATTKEERNVERLLQTICELDLIEPELLQKISPFSGLLDWRD